MASYGSVIGILLLLTQEQEPKQDRTIIHLDELTCKTFTELTQQEQGIIVAWLEGYYLSDDDPPAIDVDKLLSDSVKLIQHCVNRPEEDLLTAADAILGNR